MIFFTYLKLIIFRITFIISNKEDINSFQNKALSQESKSWQHNSWSQSIIIESKSRGAFISIFVVFVCVYIVLYRNETNKLNHKVYINHFQTQLSIDLLWVGVCWINPSTNPYWTSGFATSTTVVNYISYLLGLLPSACVKQTPLRPPDKPPVTDNRQLQTTVP